MKYSIYAALHEDINSGWVWINITDDAQNFRPRAIICIKNPTTQKKVYCEALQIDDNFMRQYNKEGESRVSIGKNTPALVINEWYRKLLGNLTTQSKQELQITENDNWIGMIISCIQHPQIIVRVASWLGIISVGLGVVGMILGTVSLFK